MSYNNEGNLQNMFKYHFGLEATLKSPILDLKTEFSIIFIFNYLILNSN